MDPLFDNETRTTLYPVKYHNIMNHYKNQRSSIWFEHEVDLNQDLNDWKALKPQEREFIENILAFFASSDFIVNENNDHFLSEIKHYEFNLLYNFQKSMEDIHSLSYVKMLDTYVTENNRKTLLLNAVATIPVIQKKAEWARKWIHSNKSFAERLIAISVIEGIFFSGAFASIFWLKERGLMKGLTTFNEFISRDENMHVETSIIIHSLLQNKISVESMHNIIKEAVEIEIEFITVSLPCALIGINKDNMIQYIKYVAERLVRQYNYPSIYEKTVQPFSFMERISLQNKSSFFETKVTDYSRKEVVTEEDPYGNL